MVGVTAPEIRRVLPDPDPRPLDEDGLLAAYAWPDRTTLRANFVTSVDGAVAVEGYSAGLGSPSDKLVFDLLRRTCDAVIVGAGTLRHEGYGPMRLAEPDREWRRRHGLPPDPVLVAVSRRLDLDPAHPMLADAPVRPVVVTFAAAPADQVAALSAVADVVACGDTVVDLNAAVTELAGKGYRRLLCEGGPYLLGTLTGADAVDEMCLTLAPKLAGPGAGRITAGPAASIRDLRLVQVLAAGDELLLRYARDRHNFRQVVASSTP
jgi:riboflavin biosynthesis pyrimidine reductase